MKTSNIKTQGLQTMTTNMLHAKFELDSLARLRNSAVRSGNLRNYDHYTQNMRDKLATHIEGIRAAKKVIVEALVAHRVTHVTQVQFHSIVDSIPYYSFTDGLSGIESGQIAYGSECHRRRQLVLAEVAAAKTVEANASLAWVDQALRNWTKTYIKLAPRTTGGFEISSMVQDIVKSASMSKRAYL